MNNGLLLWVDDEMELLTAHILFLEKKGYQLVTVNNGADAIELCQQRTFDLILLDEMMPGLSGLETLQRIKEIQPTTPVVMCTKSEEENIMEQAIGSKIADYLIKPVNPSQILLTLKKNIHRREIIAEVAQTSYQQSFQDIARQTEESRTMEDWYRLYRRLVHWELELAGAGSNMADILSAQKEEANNAFAKFVKQNYETWTSSQKSGATNRPVMSPDLFKTQIFPRIDRGESIFLVVLDNFRYDQWKMLEGEIGELFDIDEQLYTAILPTATQYARNAIFSGLMPEQIAKMFPLLWVDEDEDEGKNLNEEELIGTQIARYRRHDDFSYTKVNNTVDAERLLERFDQLGENPLNVVVFNFIDMLSHARTESRMVRELAADESAYRSITLSWFRHSALAQLFRRLSQSSYTVLLTTDHGSIRCNKPIKIVGDRNTNTNLRYKLGRNLNCNSKEIFTVKDPRRVQLPAPNISTSYVFATGSNFFAYPNNYNYYVSYYKDSFQHGGISMEEMLVPLVALHPRK